MKNKIRILHLSPHDEDDGIAKYQQHYLDGMSKEKDIENVFFDVSPLKLRFMSSDEKNQTLNRLHNELKNYDILHVQHEFGLYMFDEFESVINTAKTTGRKIVVTIHLSPGFAIKNEKLGGLGPHSWMHYLRAKRYRDKQIRWHIEPFKKADLLIVHNHVTAGALKNFGIDPDKIVKMVHPVPKLDFSKSTNNIAKHLNKKSGDVLFCTVGMMHRYKGIFDAVRTLKFLPDNYKLAIIGGVHPLSEDVPMYNKVCNLIDQLGLHSRVFITGFVKDDDEMDAYIRECDISIFPYSGKYYGHLSSGAINLALANYLPVVSYPTDGFKELSSDSEGAVILTQTYAYYELAREVERIDVTKQKELSKAYAEKMAWPKSAASLVKEYRQLLVT